MTNDGMNFHGKDIKIFSANSNRMLAGQIAEALGIADCAFSRKLRRELPDEEKEKILAIIDELKKEVQ